MSGYAFRRDPAELAVDAWRPLDRALHRWVRAHGGSERLATVAAWASLADGNGDTALALDDASRHGMPALTAVEIGQVRDERMVGDGSGDAATPFVLDGVNFYLARNHRDECAVAALLRQRRALDEAHGADEADIDALFHGERGVAVELQRQAVRDVIGRRLFVLTGGPGTGKTTTVLRMLLMLQREAGRTLRIEVAAPTGKAAQRLAQSLRHGKDRMRSDPHAPLPPAWQPLLDAIPDAGALTLHRLLGYQPWRNGFRRGPRERLVADVVVVDESSMVDLAMLRTLLEAVDAGATLILVGDADQLTSVATGSVLMDLVAALESAGSAGIVRLRHSFRAERQLVAVNEAVRAGDAGAFAAASAAAGGKVVHERLDDVVQLAARLDRWAARLASLEHLRPLLPMPAPPSAPDGGSLVRAAPAPAQPSAKRNRFVLDALDALARCQLLCALREGDFGATAVNRALESRLRRAWEADEGAEWYPGRAIIVTRNDYGAGLFNGDVGLCLADDNGHLRIWFEAVGGEEARGTGGRAVRSFAIGTLPEHETAFAITIHKSQGSEYDRAAVLLPPAAEARILSRQLLYTGLSRARASVELWTADASLQKALATPAWRMGGLMQRLCDIPSCAAASGSDRVDQARSD